MFKKDKKSLKKGKFFKRVDTGIFCLYNEEKDKNLFSKGEEKFL